MPAGQPNSRWEVDPEEVLGEGGFGAVYRGRDKKPPPSPDAAAAEDTRYCAAKKVTLEDPADKASFETELKILQKVAGHESIIELFGTLTLGSEGWLFLEMATGGELFDRLIDSGQLSERAAWPFAHAIAGAIAFCHSKGVMHRDVKLENVMLCADDPHAVRLIDFGLAHQMKLDDEGAIVDETLKDTAGTQAYRAPEISNDVGYSPLKVDVWAFGIVLFSLVSGFFPLQEAKPEDWRFKRLAGDQKGKVGACDSIYKTYKRECPFSPPLRALLDGMLTIDYEARLSVQALLEHPWLKDPPEGFSRDGEDDGEQVYRGMGDMAEALMEDLDEDMIPLARQKAARH